MQPDVSSDLKDLEGTLTTIERVLDLDELDSRARELEDQAADPSLWDNPDHAQQVTSELSRVQAKLKKIRELRQRLEDLPVLYNMAEEEAAEDPAAAEDATAMAEEERISPRYQASTSRSGSPGTAIGRKLLTAEPSVTGVQAQLSPASLVVPWKISWTGSSVPSRGSITVEIHRESGSDGSIVPRPV